MHPSNRAVLVGVSAPTQIAIDGRLYRFKRAQGVQEDIDWNQTILAENLRENVQIETFRDPAMFTKDRVLNSISQAIKNLSNINSSTIFLVLCGHGFQIPDTSGDDRTDRLDEVFALPGGEYIRDDEFSELWGN